MRRTNHDVHKTLLTKLDVSRQRLSQRAAALKKELPMDTPDAIYAIAFEEGVDIASYLSAEETEHVRRIVSELRTLRGMAATVEHKKVSSKRAVATPKPALISIGGVDVERLPGMSARTAQEAKTMAEKVYPAIYVFEHSARQLIVAVLTARIGPEWWERVVPRRIRQAAQERRDGEERDPWHGRRGATMIDYTQLTELPGIVGAGDAWPHFAPIFTRQSFFEELVNDINVSRRVAAHMNPISGEDVRHLEVAFRKWAKTLKAKQGLIP
jgi:hypothetical protein